MPKGNPRLELFLTQIEKELLKVCKSKLGYSNFSKEEWQCMPSLANDRSMAIKKAYITEARKQLNYESVYKVWNISVKF